MKKKKDFSTIILILILIVGLSIMLYPTVSNYWNLLHQSRAIETYKKTVERMDENRYQEIWNNAVKYNEKLPSKSDRYRFSAEDIKEYNSLLNVTKEGIMGYIEIPSINVSLPIYHGISEEVLQVAVGHIEGSSLPVGGVSSHCVLSGHRGLPSAKLFTDLNKMTEGDIFLLKVLNETLTYQVDQILIVKPENTSDLEIVDGKDYCTLMTCTPYGINSHRLLVRGHRIENLPEEAYMNADATQIEPLWVAPVVAAPILLILLIWILVSPGKKKKRQNRKVKNKNKTKTMDNKNIKKKNNETKK